MARVPAVSVVPAVVLVLIVGCMLLLVSSGVMCHNPNTFHFIFCM
jgi:hypothetical protein